MSPKKSNVVQNFVAWLFGSPFRDLPSEFGDPVPPELRAFEAETEDIQKHPWMSKNSSPHNQEQHPDKKSENHEHH